MTLTVIIATYGRPDCVARNLAQLHAQVPPPDQIIVVDASPDDRTADAVRPFAHVLYLRCAAGRGNVPASRNAGLTHATGEIIAFLDDDAFPHPGWAAALLDPYRDPTVAGVAGRALNGVPGEDAAGVDAIGRFTPGGKPLGHFAADPGRTVDVEHQIGCNMSFRASLLARLGGFREDFFAGPFGLCEDSDVCVRGRRLGARFVFNPAAAADHVGAKQPGGRRFGPKYGYYHARNNLTMVVRNYGPGTMALRNVAEVGGFFLREFVRKIAGAIAHVVCGLAGLAAGLLLGVYWRVRTGADPARHDAGGERIRQQLSHAATAGVNDLPTTVAGPVTVEPVAEKEPSPAAVAGVSR